MARRVVLVAGGFIATLVLVVVAAAIVIVASAPGHAVARRLAVEALRGAVDGRVTIGSLGGSLWRAAELKDVELATPDGRPVIRVARVSVRYALADLVRGRVVLSRVDLDHPTVMLERLPDGHLTLEHLFRLLGPARGGPARRPHVELDAVRITGGTLVVRDVADDPPRGKAGERRFTGIDLAAPHVVLSSPDSEGMRVDLRHLAATVSEPAVRVVDAAGRVAIRGDSARLDLSRLELPGTRGRAEGVVRWGGGKGNEGRPTVDAAASLTKASFADFRWAVAGLPEAGGGRVALRVRLYPDGTYAFSFADADFSTGGSHVTGGADFEFGPRGTLIRRLDVTAAPLDLAILAPFLGKMPVTGAVRGHLTAAGPPASLDVGADLVFADGRVSGQPENRFTGSGLVSVGGRDGVAFHRFALTDADLAMATVSAFAPSITLRGRLGLAGTLDGPWSDATFDGTMTHRDGAAGGGGADPASRVRGTARLTLADTVRVDADVLADSLSLDDLARSYPAIPLRGALAGHVTVRGPVTALGITAQLSGPRGTVTARGEVASAAAAVALSFDGSLRDVDLSPSLAGAPETRLTGEWRARLVVPAAAAPGGVEAGAGPPPPRAAADTASLVTGSLEIALAGRVAGVDVAAAGATLSLSRTRLVVDTAYLDRPGMSFLARGALGRPGQPTGQVLFELHADTLANLEPLVRWARSVAGDSTRLDVRGSGSVKGKIVGTTAAWDLSGEVTADSLAYGTLGFQGGHARGTVSRSDSGYALDLALGADRVAVGGLRYGGVAVTAQGPLGALRLHVAGDFALGSSLDADGVLGVDSTRWDARLDQLTLVLPRRRWTLTRPARFTGTAAAIAVDSFDLRGARPGGLPGASGARVLAAGRLPIDSAGDVTVEGDSVPLADVFALLQADTAGIEGTGNLTLHLVGTAAQPRITVTAALAGGRFGDFSTQLVEASASYADRRLDFRGRLGQGGATVVTATGSLPVDLALQPQPLDRRRLPGPLQLGVRADSVDLAVLDALTPFLKSSSGSLDADFTVRGTWEKPELAGSARIHDGAATVPALGARYTAIEVRLALSGDRLKVEEARIGGGPGALEIAGDVRFESLSRPVLNLTLTARSFAAFTQRDFAGLTASGALDLTGPLIGATLQGRVTVDAGFLAFADLVEKRIINLDEPEFRAVVDSNLAGAEGLGPTPQSVFMDSLRIERLTVSLGPDVWLRSHEANIQLAGGFTVVRGVEQGVVRYRLDGTLRAVRGTYRLVVGPTAKDFRVTHGTVRFFGTPDFNPELDIVAEHSVRAVQGNDLVVRVVIGGTLEVPRLSLESDQRPPLSESEIVSYLLFGRPSADLTSGAGAGGATSSEQAIFQGALSGLAGALSGELAQTLVTDLGIPVDYLAIRPGGGTVGDIFGSTRVEAGTQIGERTFLTLNAGLCQVARTFSSQTLGASVEYRMTHQWSLEASIEPTSQECRPGGFQIRPPIAYQVGMDLFWQLGGP